MNDVNATIYDLWKKRINSVIKCGEFKVLAAIVVTRQESSRFHGRIRTSVYQEAP